MNLEDFIQKFKNIPVIDSKLLLSGIEHPEAVKVQLSRWQKAGKLIQLKRGIYVLAEPYRKSEVSALHVAAVLKKPSYISLEKALEYHGLIPEAVKIYTSITTKRPGKFMNALGNFEYRNIQPSLFWGYESLGNKGQTAFMATAEKALLDMFYLNHIKISLDYLKDFRLQNVEHIRKERLFEYARRFKKSGVLKCAQTIADYIKMYTQGEKTL